MCLDNDCMCQLTFVQRKVEIKALQLSSLTLVFPNIYYGNWFTSPLPKKYFKILVCNFVWDFLLLITIRLKRGENFFSFSLKKTIFITIWIRWRFRQYLPQYNSDPHFFFLNPYRNKTFVILFSCGDIQYFLFCKVKKEQKVFHMQYTFSWGKKEINFGIKWMHFWRNWHVHIIKMDIYLEIALIENEFNFCWVFNLNHNLLFKFFIIITVGSYSVPLTTNSKEV